MYPKLRVLRYSEDVDGGCGGEPNDGSAEVCSTLTVGELGFVI